MSSIPVTRSFVLFIDLVLFRLLSGSFIPTIACGVCLTHSTAAPNRSKGRLFHSCYRIDGVIWLLYSGVESLGSDIETVLRLCYIIKAIPLCRSLPRAYISAALLQMKFFDSLPYQSARSARYGLDTVVSTGATSYEHSHVRSPTRFAQFDLQRQP